MTSVILRIGDVRRVLAEMPDESVHCVVTSPPYWGLRSYKTEPQVWGGDAACAHEWGVNGGNFCIHCGAWRGELGLEPTPDLYLEHIVAIFRDVRRVLRRDGTLWLNMGDGWAGGVNGRSAADSKAAGTDDRTFRDKPFSTVGGDLKAKDLIGMPWMLALALRADGWFLRSDIIWHKPNPMPSSVKDRPTPSHEYLFLLSKSGRYFYDHVAIQEPCVVNDWNNGSRVYGGKNKNGANIKHGARTTGGVARWKQPDGWDTGAGAHGTVHRDGRERGAANATDAKPMRQKRDVWTVATQPFRGAHFATFPEKLIAPCIQAGTSEKGVCPECGAQWRRATKRIDKGWDGSKYGERAVDATGGAIGGGTAKSTLGSSNGKLTGQTETTGFSQSCRCAPAHPVPATVLDPFGGTGTTGLVAPRLGRTAILIELQPKYAEIAYARLYHQNSLFISCPELAIHGISAVPAAPTKPPSRAKIPPPVRPVGAGGDAGLPLRRSGDGRAEGSGADGRQGTFLPAQADEGRLPLAEADRP